MNRLETICSLITPCNRFADIGCDHGLVSLYAARSGKVREVYACDISADCIEKAKKTLSGCKNAFTVVGDGFVELDRMGIDVEQTVICGMGGELIIKILSACKYKPVLILGAQKNADKLRLYLSENGYKIEYDRKVEEKNKFYDIIRAVPGEMTIDAMQAEFGVYYRERNPDLAKYYRQKLEKLGSYKQTSANIRLTEAIKEAAKWQQ